MRYELSHLVQEPSQAIFRPIQDDEALLLFALCRVNCARAEVVEVIVRRFEQTLAGGKEVTGSQFWEEPLEQALPKQTVTAKKQDIRKSLQLDKLSQMQSREKQDRKIQLHDKFHKSRSCGREGEKGLAKRISRTRLSVAASDFTNFAVTIAADRDLSIAV